MTTRVPPPLAPNRRATSRTTEFKTLLSALLCAVLATMLNSQRLVEVAERQEFGPSRDRWLNVADVVHQASTDLGLNLPAEFADGLLEGDAVRTEVVLGELAVISDPFASAEASSVGQSISGSAVEEESASEQGAESGPQESPEETAESNTNAFVDEGEELNQDPEPQEPLAPALRPVSVSDPLRVWVGGDSLGQFIGGSLRNDYANRERTVFSNDYNISTGLSRPDYFDWPTLLSEEMADADQRPEAMVLMIGGNDDQKMERPDGVVVEPQTPEWEAEYRLRVQTVMDVVGYSETRLFWINLPPMRNETRDEISSSINQIVFDEAAQRSWVKVINVIPLFTGPEGGYTDQLPDRDGVLRRTRAPDGVHLTAVSSEWIAELVWESVSAEWKIPNQ